MSQQHIDLTRATVLASILAKEGYAGLFSRSGENVTFRGAADTSRFSS